MSKLSFIDKLLDGVDVEWVSLEKILVRTKGTKITASQMKTLHKDGAPIKIFAGGKTIAFVDYNDIPAKDINTSPSIIVKSRGIIEFEYYNKPFSHKNEMWSYCSKKKSINIKYIYYFLKINEPYFQNIGSKMQMPQIATPDTDKFLVPIPCPDNPEKSLAIQTEIVRILDAFTALTNELTNELKLRKQQYQYYRDKLLSFKEEKTHLPFLDKLMDGVKIVWKPINTVINFQRGKRLVKSQLKENGDYAVYQNSMTPLGYYHESNVHAGTTFIICAGAAGQIGYSDKKFWAADDVYFADSPKFINDRFLYYFLLTKKMKLTSQVRRASIPRLSKSVIEKLEFPIPCPDNPEKSLAIQAEIVRILDEFDTLTHSMTNGLPHEIELRQKQYEYYRDQLFNFPKKKQLT